MLAQREQIARQIKTHLGVGSETIDDLMALQDEEDIQLLDEIDVDGELSEEAQEASVVRLVNEILLEAIESRASDVHIESQAAGIKVRYRIDGMLHAQPMPPEINRFQAAIISRLKIMARLNIAEKRLPQDGRIKLSVSGREVDVRVSVIPMLHGEGIVMRLLDKGRMKFSLEALGMEADMHAPVQRADSHAARHRAGHRPDRLRQNDHAVQLAARDQRRRHQDHHDRRPGRIPARRHQPDSGPSEDRADVRGIAAFAFCVTTRTSCWSAKFATWKRPRTPFRRRSPATWCSARCTPTTRRAPTRGWSTWASSRSWSPARSKR